MIGGWGFSCHVSPVPLLVVAWTPKKGRQLRQIPISILPVGHVVV